jgi:hypothetical protein
MMILPTPSSSVAALANPPATLCVIKNVRSLLNNERSSAATGGPIE